MTADDLRLARQTLSRQKAAFVVVKQGVVLTVENGQGVEPLYTFLKAQPEAVQGAVLADRIVGRAVAFLAVYFGLDGVFGEILSEGACQILESRAVRCEAQNRVPVILNRSGDGPCPIERGLRSISDPERALTFLRQHGFFH